MRKALLYKQLENKIVECGLCSHHCQIKPGERGKCAVRQNINGELFTISYGRLNHANPDLVENKGLYHFLPGSKALSISAPGCNFTCEFCQNADVSQFGKELKDEHEVLLEQVESITNEASPEAIIITAKQTGCQSIAYTYTEPTVFFELTYETAKLAKENNLKNILVTNGYMSQKAIKTIRPYIDAVSLDLKAFTNKFYKEICGAELKPVLETIKTFHKNKVWMEITTLLIPKMNSSVGEIKKIAEFIAKLNKNIPWHLTRFKGAFRMVGHQDAPEKLLQKAAEIGKKAGLKYVYIKDSADKKYTHTVCPKCGETVIERYFPAVTVKLKRGGKCSCGSSIKGVFS